jgi:KDO2-lipid IV(A) lauroyltransferase
MMLLLKPFIQLLSLFSMKALYRISDVLFFFVFHVFLYRRTVVRKNMYMSFPHYSNAKIREIERGFYRHFCDLIVENIKSNRISAQELSERVTLTNFELLEKLHQSGKSFAGVIGHLGNWEWTILRISQMANFPVGALYQPSSSKRFDRWMKKNRARFGAQLISTQELRGLLQTINQQPIGIGFLPDQGPVNVKSALWMYFMKQVTPVYKGVEKIARSKDLAVVYLHVSKTGRGQYSIRFELITDQPNTLPENEITFTHNKMLESNILEQPEIWLWSHRRWKRNHLIPESAKIMEKSQVSEW